MPRITTKKPAILASILFVLTFCVGIAMMIDSNSESSQNTATQDQPQQAEPQNVSEQEATLTQPVEEQSTPPPLAATPPQQTTPAPPASIWPVQLTSTQAASITVVVNKKHKLPSAYVPQLASVAGGQLRTEAANAFNLMLTAAKTEGATAMRYISGYRSYAKQEQLYNNYVAQDGQTAADTYSARPGHSEHQTGLAVDIGEGGGCDLETCFENTTSANWVASNAYKYGFILRYPKGKDTITGYQYEPWHLRYLGINEAAAVYNSGKTLEEYYNIPGGGYE